MIGTSQGYNRIYENKSFQFFCSNLFQTLAKNGSLEIVLRLFEELRNSLFKSSLKDSGGKPVDCEHFKWIKVEATKFDVRRSWQKIGRNTTCTHVVIMTYSQHFTTVLMSVLVEYVTDIKQIHTTTEGPFLSFTFLSLPPSFPLMLSRLFKAGKGKSHYHSHW